MAEKIAIGIITRPWAKGDEFPDAVSSYDYIRKYLDNRYGDVRDIPDDLLAKPEELLKNGVRFLIAPAQRYFHEHYFEGLITFAELGGVVLATYPTFWKTHEGEFCIQRRLFNLYGVGKVVSTGVVGKMVFKPSIEKWLLKDLPGTIQTNGRYGFIITESNEPAEGFWEITEAREEENGNTIIYKEFSNKISKLLLIRKWNSGGMFIYTCFAFGYYLDQNEKVGKLLDNINKYCSCRTDITQPKDDQTKMVEKLSKQITVYQILLAIAMLIVGILAAWIFMPNKDFVDVMKSLLAGSLTGITTFLISRLIGK